MDYSKLINQLTAEMKKGGQYARLPVAAKVFMILAMIPLIVSFVVTKMAYWVTLFCYKMISSPAEYLHEWLRKQKDEVQHGTQAVLYFVCLPAIFGFQILLSFSAFAFFILWFLLMAQGYLLTLGGIKWQPFVNEATFEEEETAGYTPSVKTASVFAFIEGGLFIAILLVSMIGDGVDSYKARRTFETIEQLFSLAHFAMLVIVNPIIFGKK